MLLLLLQLCFECTKPGLDKQQPRAQHRLPECSIECFAELDSDILCSMYMHSVHNMSAQTFIQHGAIVGLQSKYDLDGPSVSACKREIHFIIAVDSELRW